LNDKFPNAGDLDSDGVIEMDSLTQMRSETSPELFKMPDNVSETIEPLLKMKKHDICSGMGLSYISVLLDMSGVNFAAASMNAIKENTNTRVLRSKFIESFCQPIWEKFIRTLVVENKLTGVTPARFENDPQHYCRCEWTTDPREYADPLKTSRSRIENISSGRMTLTEDLAERGKDIREHINELKMERDLLKQADIALADIIPNVTAEPLEVESDEQDEPAGVQK
jgi:capsid protein